MKDEALKKYLNDTIAELKTRIGGEMTAEEENEVEAWFVQEFFLRPLIKAQEEMQEVPLSTFRFMQQILQDVFPYWLDNDALYALGRKKLALLSLIGRTVESQEELNRSLFPPVSVILPTYRRASVITRAIESVLAQTYPYLELLVVDDGSDDGTEEVVKSIADPRIRYIKNETNRGTSYAKNVGIAAASYDLIAF